jgi:transcriptional regulator with XRE-family HTH domain
MDFDRRYQTEKNGPLSPALRSRISAFRAIGSTQADIAKALSFSPSFISQMLNSKSPARVDSKHIPRIVRVLNQQERNNWKELGLPERPAASADEKSDQTTDVVIKLKDHIQAIRSLGFEVTGILPL